MQRTQWIVVTSGILSSVNILFLVSLKYEDGVSFEDSKQKSNMLCNYLTLISIAILYKDNNTRSLSKTRDNMRKPEKVTRENNRQFLSFCVCTLLHKEFSNTSKPRNNNLYCLVLIQNMTLQDKE